jgi:hypothetical protein
MAFRHSFVLLAGQIVESDPPAMAAQSRYAVEPPSLISASVLAGKALAKLLSRCRFHGGFFGQDGFARAVYIQRQPFRRLRSTQAILKSYSGLLRPYRF